MPPALGRPRLLVVDDDALVLGALELLLMERWEVDTANSAAEAREILDREQVAVVISDQRMPKESGVDLLAWCFGQHPDTVRILLTGYTDAEAVVDAINRAQVWRYIRKPWDNRQVIGLVERALEHRAQEIEARKRYEGTLRSLVTALEASHPFTDGHSERVAEFAELLCEDLLLAGRERASIVLAAQLHDIGKIGIDSHYLDKTDALSAEEQSGIRTHVEVGERILHEAGFLEPIIPLVAAHHEWFDGSGYPAGLMGEGIPFGARILAVADAFEAMTSDRAHRRGCSRAEAFETLRADAGTQFDPAIVESFSRCFDRSAETPLISRPGTVTQRVTLDSGASTVETRQFDGDRDSLDC
jgi:putative nucleotidyltransferase with HDIG domain